MEKKRVFILPGEISIARSPTIIATLLGSCIAVCLYNRAKGGGGMNHFMLPEGQGSVAMGKYGDYATEKLIQQMLKMDPDKGNITTKIYGGGAVVGHLNTGFKVGVKNIAMAKNILSKHGLRISFEDVGGELGRKIYFDNTTGDVRMEFIQKSEQRVEQEEKKKSISGRRIRTLIVDDSATVRSLLRRGLSADPTIEIVGEAEDAFEARNMILELNPDVITLDIIMPKMDGVSFLKKLMVHYPKPVIIVSSVAQRGSKMRLRAEDIGAVDVVDKEDLNLYKGMDNITKKLGAKVKLAANRVIKKRAASEVKDI